MCWAYAETKVNNRGDTALAMACRPPTIANKRSLARIRSGFHPCLSCRVSCPRGLIGRAPPLAGAPATASFCKKSWALIDEAISVQRVTELSDSE